jgi:SAM-dependent methyltransferase
MIGVSFEEKVAEQKALLEQALSDSGALATHGMALDLGCGPGFQTIALAELGFSPVVAVDTSTELLRELEEHKGSYPIETREADLASLEDIELSGEAVMAVCMGDTLTHLPSREGVARLFTAVFRKLASGGTFVITYRDLTSELTGVDRFLPVRGDDRRIMTCFLEYESADAVVVSDLVHVRGENGWTLEKSSYRKLRLSQQWVADALTKAGFSIRLQGPAGRLLLAVARKH